MKHLSAVSAPRKTQALIPGRRRRTLACLLAASMALGACMGVPLRSLPRLLNLHQELLDAHPAEFMFAVQTDDRVIPRAGAAPTLDISVKPAEGSGVESWERKLPMRLVVQDRPAGLPAAPAGRRWMVYRLMPESQVEMARQQVRFRSQLAERKDHPAGKTKGTLTVGIAQEGITVDDPRLAYTNWSSWLQTSSRSGYFELWSGTINDLKAMEQRAAARDKKTKP